MKAKYRVAIVVLVLVLALLSCSKLLGIKVPNFQIPALQPRASEQKPTAAPTLLAPIISSQPFLLRGNFKSTAEIGGKLSDDILYSERQVILIDMHGFITRNLDWEIPVESQVLGHVQFNPQDASGTYTLYLPEIPQGTLNDVDHNGKQDIGVEVFAVDYEPNISGDAFMTGDDSLRGWPGDMASVKTSTDRNNEVTGGKLVVYAPDNHQGFPSSFGPDGKLFTSDDPISTLPAGYSIVDLDTSPFSFSQPAQADLPLYESPDTNPKDYSSEPYTQAFDDLLKFLRTNYAFNGIPGKQPDWDKLSAQIRPRIEQAQQAKDPQSFYSALRDFTYAFKDGHVGLDGGDFTTQDFNDHYSGGFGFTVRVLDNQEVLVNSVLKDSQAQAAGIKAGAILTLFNGQPVLDVIKAQPLVFGNQSSDTSILYNQAIVLTRSKPGSQVQVEFTNPGEPAKSASLTAVPEVDSLLSELDYNKNDALVPVELRELSGGGKDIGYIRINSNLDDLNLIIHLFERGLKDFSDQKVTGLIIDLRNNSGGVPLGLAGFLTNQDIPLGQMEYYDQSLGKFTPFGERDKFTANQTQYRFNRIAVLVGLNCASACELEAYGFSQVPGAMVLGEYPSAGIEAEVSKGQIKMPEKINMQFPTGRIVDANGGLFLEGSGVQPTIRIPVNAENVLSDQDVILQAAIKALSGN